MRYLICGHRAWKEHQNKPLRQLIRMIAEKDPSGIVINGAAKGVDTFAGTIALAAGLKVIEFPAEWERMGRRAGPTRNQKMLDDGKPDFVMGFHDNLAVSRGTNDMLMRAVKQGYKTCLIGSSGKVFWKANWKKHVSR